MTVVKMLSASRHCLKNGQLIFLNNSVKTDLN